MQTTNLFDQYNKPIVNLITTQLKLVSNKDLSEKRFTETSNKD